MVSYIKCEICLLVAYYISGNVSKNNKKQKSLDIIKKVLRSIDIEN